MPRISFSISIYFTFAQNRSFLDIMPNFNLLPTLELVVYGPVFPRIYGRHQFSLYQVLVENLRKWRHFLKNTAQVEIIMTINVENCTNIWAKGFVILYANCCANCYYNFNPGETTRGERSDCFTPEKSNTFRTHPCKGENSSWKTPTLAETPPKGL